MTRGVVYSMKIYHHLERVKIEIPRSLDNIEDVDDDKKEELDSLIECIDWIVTLKTRSIITIKFR